MLLRKVLKRDAGQGTGKGGQWASASRTVAAAITKGQLEAKKRRAAAAQGADRKQVSADATAVVTPSGNAAAGSRRRRR